MLATTTAERRRYTLAVDYGDGWESVHSWITTEMDARRYFTRQAGMFRGFGPVALLDGSAHVLAASDVWGSGR